MSRFLFLIFWISAVVCSGNAEEPQDDDTPGLELVGTNIAALGEVTLLDRPQSVFVLTNRTDQTLAIRSLRRTCACITASVDTMSVPPGGSARITMVLDLTGIQGSFKRALWVTLADSDRKRILLQQAGTVLPLFNGLPDGEVALSAPDLATACWTNTFILTPTDPRLRLGTPLFAATNSALRQTATLVTNAAPQGTYTLTVVLQALTNAHAETRLLLPVTGAENRKDQLLLKLNAKVGQRLTVRPDQLYLRESPRPTLNRFLLRTDTESADPALLTWTPQLEGMTVTPRTVKSKSSLLVTLTLTPQAVKTWLAQPEASLSFAYTNHAPAIIRVLPALDGGADTDAAEEEVQSFPAKRK
ncbi:MAG: DUF1573 domain-containing protein [Kiritimatiellae bacterium]|jgi:hypothetical protein|nr:DUF1573 domain-containing protein [Kiritimatiellia bacterium]MDD3582949.1 DUF1573 domain-containing protein [Kiritimatiellia bacterium]